jgi:hypothetical protein
MMIERRVLLKQLLATRATMSRMYFTRDQNIGEKLRQGLFLFQ